jgi:hypothetical protein
MTTLTVHIDNSDQETAIRTILDALHVQYDENDSSDTTAYLLSSPANAAHLKKSIEQAERGEGASVNLDTLFSK